MTKFNWKSKTAKLAILLLVLTFIIPQAGCQSNGENYQGIGKTGFYLDTVCAVTIYGVAEESPLGEELSQAKEEDQQKRIYQLITDAFKLCSQYENLLSKTIPTSEIAQINDAAGQGVTVSSETLEVVKKGMEYGKLSDGRFDITIGTASQLWDFHDVDENHEGEGEIPSEDALAEAVRHVDYTKVQIDGTTVKLQDPEMEIDLGGIAKGYISDKVAEYLEDQGVVSAVVDLGGNIVTIGGKTTKLVVSEEDGAHCQPFNIGIKDPQSTTGQLLMVFPCKDKAVVTSGTYERFLIKEGTKYHHILDPKTGWPVDTDILSVTIIVEKGHGVDADGLSTTCLAMGVEEATAFIQGLKEAMEIDAVFVDVDGNVTATDENIL